MAKAKKDQTGENQTGRLLKDGEDISHLPQSVQDSINNAAQIEDDILAQGSDGGTPTPASQDTAPAEEAPASGVQETAPADTPAKTPADEQPSTTNTEPVADTSPEYAELLQKHRTLQGMMASNNSTHAGEIAHLNSIIRGLQAQVGATGDATQGQPPAEQKQFLTDEDKEQYGDMVGFVERAVAQATQGLTSDLTAARKEIASLKGLEPQVHEAARNTATQREDNYQRTLTELVGTGWQSLAGDAGWNAYLNEVNPMLGTTNNAILLDAEKQGDARRVAAIINGYRGIAGTQPTGGGDPTPAGDGAEPTPIPMEQAALVAPSLGKVSNTPTPEAPPTITRQEMVDFELSVQRGTATEAEIVAHDARVNACQRAGTIT